MHTYPCGDLQAEKVTEDLKMTSIKRPKATDTEDDLLAFQENFLSHKEKPSVVLKKVKVQDSHVSTVQHTRRDVVTLSTKDVGM